MLASIFYIQNQGPVCSVLLIFVHWILNPKMNFMENKTLTQLESLAKTFKSSLAYYDEADSFADSVIEADY